MEFILAFEAESPAEFLDLVSGLRSTEASRYTALETPIFTCVLTSGRSHARFGGWAAVSRSPGSRSRALSRRASRVLVGGVNSPVRSFRAVGGSPVFFVRGEGAYLVDVDGRRYLDLLSSWGANLLGNAPPRIVRAVRRTATRGLSLGAHGARTRAGREDPSRRPHARANAVRKLRNRGGHERGPDRARLHRAVEGGEVRWRISRSFRRVARSGWVRPGDGRATRLGGCARFDRRGDAGRPL